jgi:hypothetical protein
MALDLEPDEICWHVLKIVKRAERRLWLLRLKARVKRGSHRLRGLWGLE